MIEYRITPAINNEALNDLFANAWPDHSERDFAAELAHALLWVCAYDDDCVVGYVSVAWNGGKHGFLLDTTVDTRYQRRGIGQELCRVAANAATEAGLDWLHVDFEPHLLQFYRGAGFRNTEAGLMDLREG